MLESLSSLWSTAFHRPAKRQPRLSRLCHDRSEELEDRRVLSATSGVEAAAVSKMVVTYPDYTGVWNLTVVPTLDGQSQGTLTGTVEISQNKGKITGNVHLTGYPEFSLKGKLSKSDVEQLNGSSKFPVQFGDSFHSVNAKLSITYSGDHLTFNGTLDKTLFGHHAHVTIAGTKTT